MSEDMRVKETYLGDDVYASFDGFQICLRTSEPHHVIYLEPNVFMALVRYAEGKIP